jgi:threonine dehydrogenase-like Zn-dependent dehydrogenase
MRAITILPGVPNSARLDEVPAPPLSDGPILVKSLALGVCGTDREIVGGEYGWAPPGQDRLVLGHESLGVVEEAPDGVGLKPGDLVVGIVRHPDPVPCAACAAGEWDMCLNGRYTERGIKERHGFGAEYFRLEPDFAVKIDPALGVLGVLMEPASIVAKAWDHIERIGNRSRSWRPRKLLVTGAGPIGQLAALMGRQRGLEVHVFDRGKTGRKPALVSGLGGIYHAAGIETALRIKPDIVIECTGATPVIREVIGAAAAGSITCLTGVTSPGRLAELDIGWINRTIVLDNQAVFGTVNANRHHYEMAADALVRADWTWLDLMISRHVPLELWEQALENRPDDIKVIVEFADHGSEN